MDKKQGGLMGASSNSMEEDPFDALTENFAKFELPPLGSRNHVKAERLFADSKKSNEEDGHLFDPASFSEDNHVDMLGKFLKKNAPSTVKRSDGIGWIRVISASNQQEGLGNLEELEADWKKLQKSRKVIDFDAVKQLAISHRCLGGIWLLFLETGKEIDSAWEKIAMATVRDELGTHAKVTPCEDTKEAKALYGALGAVPEQHVVSVYTRDFTDKDDVMKVEAKLRSLGFREQIVFKPRVYSRVGVYAQNQWGLKPSIYTSDWDPGKRAGNIRDCTRSPATYMINGLVGSLGAIP